MIGHKPIVSLQDLAWRLGIPLDRLRAIAKDTKAYYSSFSLRKGAKTRTIRPPNPELMHIQRRLNDRVFCHYEPAESAHGRLRADPQQRTPSSTRVSDVSYRWTSRVFTRTFGQS